MRYSVEPKCRKHVKEYGFLSFPRKFGDRYGKKLMDTATKTGIDATETPGSPKNRRSNRRSNWK